MMAAITASLQGDEVVLVEKTSILGNKLKITGKGRCNLTFSGDADDFKNNIVKNYRFLYSSFTNFSNVDTIKFFEDLGIKTKVERGNRVFPISDDANDIVNALKLKLKKENVKVLLNSSVTKLVVTENQIIGAELKSGEVISCDKCILATGGKSYPTTGSTGDGYILSQKVGHDIQEILPGLVPLRSHDNICKKLQGLTLKNIKYALFDVENNKIIYEDFGELLFAHFGITGPVVLSSSSVLNRYNDVISKIKSGKIYAVIDLKPALDLNTLDKRICRDFEKYSNKEFKNSLNDLLPQKLIPEIIRISKIDEDKKVHQINKEERKRLVYSIKSLKVKIDDFMPLELAIITCGGVNVKEVNPKTMESKIVKGLYFAGEILDIDAYTGGYNLQIAFSTAVAAGNKN